MRAPRKTFLKILDEVFFIKVFNLIICFMCRNFSKWWVHSK